MFEIQTLITAHIIHGTYHHTQYIDTCYSLTGTPTGRWCEWNVDHSSLGPMVSVCSQGSKLKYALDPITYI